MKSQFDREEQERQRKYYIVGVDGSERWWLNNWCFDIGRVKVLKILPNGTANKFISEVVSPGPLPGSECF